MVAGQAQDELLERRVKSKLVRLRGVIESEVAGGEFGDAPLLSDGADAAALNTHQEAIVQRLANPAPRADHMLRFGYDRRKPHILQSVRFQRPGKRLRLRCVAVQG